MYDRILVPTDGSEQADRAFEQALDLAKTYHADLHLLNVVNVTTMATEFDAISVVEDLEARGDELTASLADRARDAGVETVTTAVVEGIPHRAILDYAEDHDVDLVVMGTHGRTGLSRYLLGSVTQKVVRLADVPVLTVRTPEETDETEEKSA